MIKKNKVQLIITSVAILLPVVIGLIIWDELPAEIATHWGTSGEADSFSSKAFAVFGFPLILLAFHWLCIIVTTKLDPKSKDISKKMMSLVLWIIPAISLVMSTVTYLVALGKEIRVVFIVTVFMGIMFIIIGNYLPKCRQSYTMGIKLPWTLKSEDNWNKTHRFSGVLWVIGGVVILATAILESIIVFFSVVLLMVILPTVYSYLHYKRNNK
ncbi:MAG: SdpI family protein [Clostridia bacterium]|nr:SdpI family protein [Clostridia bacterium]